MKILYVVLTKSGTAISRVIDRVTNVEYTHSSISFTPKISPMYSFGRRLTFLNYPAGLKKEPLDHGFYRIYDEADIGIFEFEVSDEAYMRVYSSVMKMYRHKHRWRYSTIGLWLCKRGVDIVLFHRRFCSQFVAECLELTGEIKLEKPASLYQPIDFVYLKEGKCIFKGKVKDVVGLDFSKEI